MSWQVTEAPAPHDECPHCGTIKRVTSLVCRPCFREIPWPLWRDLKTAEGIEHVHVNENTLSPYRTIEACAAAVQAATRAIFQHLKLHSSAIHS